jgi:hypothetical protein
MSAPENKAWDGTPTKFLVSILWVESPLALGVCGPVYDVNGGQAVAVILVPWLILSGTLIRPLSLLD